MIHATDGQSSCQVYDNRFGNRFAGISMYVARKRSFAGKEFCWRAKTIVCLKITLSAGQNCCCRQKPFWPAQPIFAGQKNCGICAGKNHFWPVNTFCYLYREILFLPANTVYLCSREQFFWPKPFFPQQQFWPALTNFAD